MHPPSQPVGALVTVTFPVAQFLRTVLFPPTPSARTKTLMPLIGRAETWTDAYLAIPTGHTPDTFTIYIFTNIDERRFGEAIRNYSAGRHASFGQGTTVIPNVSSKDFPAHGLNTGFTCRHCGLPAPRLASCAICRCTRYCSKQCQKQDWQHHRAVCSPIGSYHDSMSMALDKGTRYGIISEYDANLIMHLSTRGGKQPIIDQPFSDIIRYR